MNTSSQAGLATFIERVPVPPKVHVLVHPHALTSDAITSVPKAA